MDAELESAALKVKEELRDKQRALLSSADMQQYAIRGNEEKWEQELKANGSDGWTSEHPDGSEAWQGKRKVVHENTNKRKGGGEGAGLSEVEEVEREEAESEVSRCDLSACA